MGGWYSRALQAFTTHYFRITCGSSQASGTFPTANIALGNTYNDPLPADPAVSSRPYYSGVGSYAWPEFLNWNNQDPTARSESVIDPQTGMLLKRLALPQDQPITYLPGGGDHSFSSAFSSDGAWNVPANAVTVDDNTSATFSGTQSNFLTMRDQNLWNAGGTNLADLTLPTEWITLSLKAWCSGTCAGEDAKVQACLTVNGVTCWPTNGTAKYQEVALGSSATGNFVTLGTTVPILDSWTPAGFAPAEPGRHFEADGAGKCGCERSGDVAEGRLSQYLFQRELDQWQPDHDRGLGLRREGGSGIDAVDDRPGLVFDAPVTAVDGRGVLGRQLWISAAQEDGEHGHRSACSMPSTRWGHRSISTSTRAVRRSCAAIR